MSGTGVTDAAVLAAVAAETGAMEAHLAELVAAPTVLGNEEPGQVLMEEAFRSAGLETRSVPLDAEALRGHPLASPFSWTVDGKRNVVGTWAGAGEGRSLVLNGHIDVVPPAAEELWTRPPYEAHRDGEWIYGRGAGDMKAGLVAMVGVVRALRALGVTPRGDLTLQSVVEEECGGNGAVQCLIDLQAHGGADAVVIPEPFPRAVLTSQVGVLWFHIDLVGTPAHAGSATLGENAVEAMFPIVAALRELEAELNVDPPAPYDVFPHPINLNVGTITGGDWTSTVAAQCTVGFRLATYPGRPVIELKRRVEETVAGTAALHPYLAAHVPRVRYDGFAVDGAALRSDDPIVTALAQASQAVTGEAAPAVPSTATTDARVFLLGGIPAACLGPRAENIHAIDERVHAPSIVETAQTLALLVRDWCGVAG